MYRRLKNVMIMFRRKKKISLIILTTKTMKMSLLIIMMNVKTRAICLMKKMWKNMRKKIYVI